MTKRDQSVFIYGALAAVLLLSLLKMPYGFYEFVRFAAMAAFAYLAYKEYDNKGSKDKMILFIVLAVCKKQVFDQQFSEKLISADFGKLVLHVVIDKAVMRQRAAASLLGA